MKKLLIILLFFAAVMPASLYAQATQDKLDLPGDNLNLYAVLKLFQESETLEGFERKLNEENSEINNLDLNGDNKTDYIKVIDNVDGEVHTIVLQTDISATEKQDIAVFTVQKDAAGKVQVQLIGDEELYGKNYIIEPNATDNIGTTETPNPGYTGNEVVVDGQSIPVERTTTVVIASWPMVEYIYQPSYSIWHSPWYWNYYPSYWNPWAPVYWHQYWGYHSNWNYWYYGNYRRWPAYRYNRWNDFYFNGRRSRSAFVDTRRQNGLYRNTYSRPETRAQGVALYNRVNPPDNRQPVNRPIIQRPVTRPAEPADGNGRPIGKPMPPLTRPDVDKPIVKPGRPVTDRPVTNPGRPVDRPGVKPVQPIIKPSVERPVVKPVRPAVERPVTKPVERPSTRPARPAVQHPAPATRPVQPRPTQTRPVQPRPVETRPAAPVSRPAPQRPVERKGGQQ